MANPRTRISNDLIDAAAVHAACRRVVEAIGELAVRPLDEAAAQRMRDALDHAHTPEMKVIVARLSAPRRRWPSTSAPAATVGVDLDLDRLPAKRPVLIAGGVA